MTSHVVIFYRTSSSGLGEPKQGFQSMIRLIKIAPVKGWGYRTAGRTLAWAWVPTPPWGTQDFSVQRKFTLKSR